MEYLQKLTCYSPFDLKSKTCPELSRRIQNLKWIALCAMLFALCVFGALLLALCVPAHAQVSNKVYRVGYLSLRWTKAQIGQLASFKEGMRELGFVHGENYVIEYRNGKGDPERLQEVANELARLNVDVILTSPGRNPTRAAKRATKTIPIVMSGSRVDPVDAGYVASLARPGGNMTGLADLRAELYGKRLEILKEAFPHISRLTMLLSRDQLDRWEEDIAAEAKAFGIQVQSIVAHRNNIERTFAEISRKAEGLAVTAAGGASVQNRGRIIEFAMERRLPAIYDRRRFVKAGGLMSYGTDILDLYRQSAKYVAKILKGANPAELPIQRPKKFELVINLRTAKQLGVTFPPSLLLQATKVIK